MEYPEVLFTISKIDNRKKLGYSHGMKTKMNNLGYKTYYFQNAANKEVDSSTKRQKAKKNFLIYSYLLKKLN